MKCKIMLMTHGKLAESLSATAELICGEKVAFKNMPEVVANTVKLAERCNVEFEFGHTMLPNFDTPNNMDHFEFLRYMCYNRTY